jgi:hypothetical protein
MFSQRLNYEEGLSSDIGHHPKKFHKYIRQKKKARVTVGPLLVQQSLTDDPDLMVEALSTAFASVFSDQYPPDLCSHQTFDGVISSVHLSEGLVHNQLKQLRVDAGPGQDGVMPIILKNCCKELSLPLSLIFRKSLVTGKLPISWKSARISPIYKGKGSRSDPLNYRPISLTSTVCKTMERLVASALSIFFSENHILNSRQFGFCPGHSTVDQLLLTYNDITLWHDHGHCVNLILFDFSKAFDRVNHCLLLKKLKSVGVTGYLLAWISDFLVGRKMSVSVGGSSSCPIVVTSGVPQGSVLGPILFLIFINHVVSSISCKYMIFADDLKIYLNSETAFSPELQQAVDLLYDLATDWGLVFNTDKCANVRFSRGLYPDLATYFVISDSPILCKSSHRDLGVTVDSSLKFHRHIEEICGKVGGMATNFLKSTICRSSSFMMNILTSHLRPILEYASPLWNTGYLGDLILLESVQRRWTKIVEGLEDLPYGERLRVLKLFSIKGRLWRADMILCYKIFHHLCIIVPSDLFVMSPYQGTRGHCYKIFVPQCSVEPRKRFFSVRIIEDWNNLLPQVVMASSLNIFKRLLTVYSDDKLYDYHDRLQQPRIFSLSVFLGSIQSSPTRDLALPDIVLGCKLEPALRWDMALVFAIQTR